MGKERIPSILWLLAVAGCQDVPDLPAAPESDPPLAVAATVDTSRAAPVVALLPSRRPSEPVYGATKIGNQWWLRQNLDFDTLGHKLQDWSKSTPTGDSATTWCPDGSVTVNCGVEGRFYDWIAVVGSRDTSLHNWCDLVPEPRGICPAGWHVPSREEWEVLREAVDSTENPNLDSSARDLRAATGWRANGLEGGNPHPDPFGFGALPAGYRYSGNLGYGWYGHTPADSSILGRGTVAAYWTRSHDVTGSCTSAWAVFLTAGNPAMQILSIPRTAALSVRCLKDDTLRP